MIPKAGSTRQSKAGHLRATAGRAVVVSASIGAGHDAAADEIARRLRDQGLDVEQYDFLDLLPGRMGRLVCGGYQRMLTVAPWAYRLIYRGLDQSGDLGRQASMLSRLSARRLREAIADDAVVVVSTYPLASQALGSLRTDKLLSVPVVTYLTDYSVHRLWVAAGVDLHLAIHDIPSDQARGHGAAKVVTVRPVVDPRFSPASSEARTAARVRYGLPETGAVALVIGGSWGAGKLARAVHEITATGLVTCAVVCGRNERLRERLRASGIEHAFGWIGDMPALMNAVDVVVQNAGGMTVQEAAASGLPVISYRCIPGHGLTNAAALHQADVARWAQTSSELAALLLTLDCRDAANGSADEVAPARQAAASQSEQHAQDPIQMILDLAVAARTRTTGAISDPASLRSRIARIPSQRTGRSKASAASTASTASTFGQVQMLEWPLPAVMADGEHAEHSE
jgi:UDP-N-acetylglucosamine:LPS N-acetylglucosamine transferase